MKILIFSIRVGMGHIKAGEAVLEGINSLNSCAKLSILFDKIRLGRFINASYLWMARYNPLLWAMFYKNSLFYNKIGKKYFDIRIKHEIERLIKQEKPKVVVSTHPFIASSLSTIPGKDFKIISVATDFDCHPIGINNDIDLFIIPHKKTKEILLKKGIPDEKIKVIGIPISLKFSRKKDILKSDFGFDGKPIILEIGGGYGLGHMERFLPQLSKIKNKFQVIVIAGFAERLKRKLEISLKKHGINGKVFGFVDNVDELMKISNILLGKPGGISTMEAASCGLPIVISEVIKGHEEMNAEILIEEGIALWPRYNDIPKTIEMLLNDNEKMNEMKKKAYKFSTPHASYEIAKTILELV